MERVEDWAACQEACLALGLSLPVRIGDVGKSVPFARPQFSYLRSEGVGKKFPLLALVGSALLGGVCSFS